MVTGLGSRYGRTLTWVERSSSTTPGAQGLVPSMERNGTLHLAPDLWDSLISADAHEPL
jgi:hypothetical protein